MVPRSMRNKSAMEIKAQWKLRSVATSAGFTQVRSSDDDYSRWRSSANPYPFVLYEPSKLRYAADCSGFSEWTWMAAPKPEERGVDKDICTMDELCNVLEAVS